MESVRALSEVLLWLWDGDSSLNQKGERPSLEAGTLGLVRDSRPTGLNAC
jgi:hypothetical protein